jgi:hypothetical protein
LSSQKSADSAEKCELARRSSRASLPDSGRYPDSAARMTALNS